MTLAVPLSIRLVTSRADRNVTSEVDDLSFRSIVPGGFASAMLTLRRPIRLMPDELGYYGRLIIMDGRNGSVVWEGRVEDPGRSAGAEGPQWQINALGPSVHARDRKLQLIYVDRSLDRWTPSNYGSKNVEKRKDEGPNGDPSILLGVAQGTTINTSWEGDHIYRAANEAAQKLARVSMSWVSGRTDGNFVIRLYFRTGTGGSPGNAAGATWNTVGGTLSAAVGGTNFSNGHDVVNFRAQRNTSSVTAGDDTYWVEGYNISVVMMRYNADGSEVTSGYTVNTVKGHQVVNDLLGRVLTQYDGAGASVQSTAVDIDQLAYSDGATPAEILDDLISLETGSWYWAAWERSASGKYSFEWRSWPTSIRYEAGVDDGFESPGAADGLFNAVTVRWVDAKGLSRRTRVTSTVADLDAAGIVREECINAGSEIGSATGALALANNFLADRGVVPNAGRLTIARPILDSVTGRMVAPWEIRPGHLIRVRGVQPRPDALNATSRDGVTVFKIVSVEFRAATASAVLELDSFAVTTQRQLSNLATFRPRPK